MNLHRMLLARAEENMPIRVGLIGCGLRGMQLLKELRRLDFTGNLVTVAAVCDIWNVRRREARQRSGALAYADWRRIIDQTDIDAVVIATPDHWHAPMAIAAMEAGKDVYCESPMTRTLEEAKDFRDTVTRCGRIVQIGAMDTAHPQWRVGRDLIQKGLIGSVRWSQAANNGAPPRPPHPHTAESRINPGDLDWQAFLGSAPRRPFDPHRFFTWHKYWDYAGDISAERNYDRLAALLLAIGPEVPDLVSAAGGITPGDDCEMPNAFMMTAKYPGGHSVILSSATKGTAALPATVRGSKASLEFHGDRVLLNSESAVRLRPLSKPDAGRTVKIDESKKTNHLAEWIDALRTREKCTCDETLGFAAMAAVAMSLEAYRKQKAMYYDRPTQRMVARS